MTTFVRGYRVDMAYRTHTGRVAEPTIIATFAGLSEARRAIEALQFRIDSTHMTLLGSRADAAETRAQERIADRELTDRVERQLFRGGILGAVVGAVAGAIIGVLVVVLTSAPSVTILATTLVLALLMAVFWPYGEVITKLGNDDAWEETLAGVPDGPVRLGVRTADAHERDWALTTLRAHHATAIEERS
jgi:hypothetical protein